MIARFACFIAVLMGVFTPCACQADLIIGNFPGNDQGLITGLDSSIAYSMGFTVGSTPLTLNTVDFRLSASGASGNAILQLRSDNGGQPSNTVVTTFNNQLVNTAAMATYSFTPTVPTPLLASTTYWLTITTDLVAVNGLGLGSNDPSLTPTGPFATFAGLRFGPPNDQSGTLPPIFPVPSFQVNGTAAVPEPKSFLAVVAILLVFGMMHYFVRYEALSELKGGEIQA